MQAAIHKLGEAEVMLRAADDLAAAASVTASDGFALSGSFATRSKRMPTNLFSSLLVVAALMLTSITLDVSFSAAQRDYEDCRQTEDVGRSVAACTRIINDPVEPAAYHAAAYMSRGTALVTAGKLDEAIGDYNAAIQLYPRSVIAYAARAIAYARKGDGDHAVADYRQASAIDAAKIREMATANEELKALTALAPAQPPPARSAASASPPAPAPDPQAREQKTPAPRVDEARKSEKQERPYAPTRKDVDAPFPRLKEVVPEFCTGR
jgi:tetratricopeptide (TPR) repeat protein